MMNRGERETGGELIPAILIFLVVDRKDPKNGETCTKMIQPQGPPHHAE